MAYEETPEEKQKRQALEADWKAKGQAAEKPQDEKVMKPVREIGDKISEGVQKAKSALGLKKGGKVRGDGIAQRGKTKGRFC